MNITKFHKLPALVVMGWLLQGCVVKNDMARLPVPPVKTLTAMGYGTVDRNRFLPAQRRLMGMRASKMEAYRALAEQIYGVHLNSHTTVENMMVKNDSYRSYIDSVVRGARVKSITAIDADTYETVMEIDLTPHFYECVGGPVAVVNECLGMAQGLPMSALPEGNNDPGRLVSGCNNVDCYPYPDTRGFIAKPEDTGNFLQMSYAQANKSAAKRTGRELSAKNLSKPHRL